MCESQRLSAYQEVTIKRLWTAIYILSVVTGLAIIGIIGVAVYAHKQFDEWEYSESTEYYIVTTPDENGGNATAVINSEGVNVHNGNSNCKKDNKKEEKEKGW